MEVVEGPSVLLARLLSGQQVLGLSAESHLDQLIDHGARLPLRLLLQPFVLDKRLALKEAQR